MAERKFDFDPECLKILRRANLAQDPSLDEAHEEDERLRADCEALRDHARAYAFSLAEELALTEITRLKSLLSRARDTLDPIGKVAGDESTDDYRIEIWGRDARTAREVAAEIAKELGDGSH